MIATTILNPSHEDLTELNKKLCRTPDEDFTEIDSQADEKPFAIYIRKNAKIIAGVLANVYRKGVEIESHWVDRKYRYTNVEAELIRKTEFFGRQQGALVSFLKTDEVNYFYHDNGYNLCSCTLEPTTGKEIYYLRKLLQESKQFGFFG